MDDQINVAEKTLEVLADILNYNFYNPKNKRGAPDPDFAFFTTVNDDCIGNGLSQIGMYLYPGTKKAPSMRLTFFNIVGTSTDCLCFYNETNYKSFTNIPFHDPNMIKKAVTTVESIVSDYVDYVNLGLKTKITTKYKCNHEIMK